jgi:hypothetical protein
MVATLNDSIIVRREDADGYIFSKTQGSGDSQILSNLEAPAPRCLTMDFRGPVAEHFARRSMRPALIPMWRQNDTDVERILVAVDGDLSAPYVLQPVTNGSTVAVDLEVLRAPVSPAIYGGSLWHFVDKSSAFFASSPLSNWSSLASAFPGFAPPFSPGAVLFWVGASTEILCASRTGDPVYSITAAGGLTPLSSTFFSGSNSVVRGADDNIVYFLTTGNDSLLFVQERLNRTSFSLPPELVASSDASLMAGERTVLAFLITSGGRKVPQAFDEARNWITPGPTDIIIGSQDVPTFLASMDRIIYFQIYVPSDMVIVVYSFDEEAFEIVQICSLQLPQAQAATTPSVAIVNQLLAIRWPHGAVRLIRRSLFAALPDFGPTPVFMKSRKLIWATQGPTARLFFTHFDHSIGETALVSPTLPCIDDIDCSTYIPGSTCGGADRFCNIPLAPESLPTPQGKTICVPPAPANATCGPNGWVINSTVVITPGSTVIITSPTIINGNLSVSSGSTLNVTFPANGSPTAPIVVNGCVQFAGTLNVDIGQPPTSNVNSPLITFDGYCGGVQTNFTVTSINLGCAKLKPGASGLQYGERSLTLLFSKDDVDESGCSSGVAGGLSTGAIVGIAVGAAVLVLAIIFIIIWVNREKIIPHYRLNAEMKQRSSAVNKNL